jgi:hypothetical protein
MFAKITPEENKKRMVERCKELLKEIDTAENQLSNNAVKLKSLQADLKEEIGRSLCELKDLEENRLQFLRESLNKLCLADDLCIDRMNETATANMTQISALNAETEISGLLLSIDSMLTEVSSQEASSSSGNGETTAENCADLYPCVDKLLESFEYTRSTLQRLNFGILEVIEAEKSFCKGIQKLLDKHGNPKTTQNRRASATAASMGIGTAPTPAAAELLASFESPSTRAAWEHYIRSYSIRLDMHSQAVEVFTEKICVPLEAVISSLHNSRRELNDRKTASVKCIEAAQSNIQKQSQKLAKVQQTLRERRVTVRRAKEDLTDGSASSSASAAALDEPAAETEEADGTTDRLSFSDAADPPNQNPAQKSSTASMMKSLEKMRATKLSVVVGLEKKEDRINRIDTQISGLEEEEEELTIAHASALVALTMANESVRKDILAAISDAKGALNTHITNLKPIIFDAFVSWQTGSIDSWRKLSAEAHAATNSVVIQKDVEHFVQTFAAQGDHSVGANAGAYITMAPDIVQNSDFAVVELFERIPSDLVDEDRQMVNPFQQSGGGTGKGASAFASAVNAAVAQHHQSVGNNSGGQVLSPSLSNNETPVITPVRSVSGSPTPSTGSMNDASPMSGGYAASVVSVATESVTSAPSITKVRSESPPLRTGGAEDDDNEGPLSSEIVKIEAKRSSSNADKVPPAVVISTNSGKSNDNTAKKPTAATQSAAQSSSSKTASATPTSPDSWGVSIGDMYDGPKPVVDFGVAPTHTADSVSPPVPSAFPNVANSGSNVGSAPVIVQATTVTTVKDANNNSTSTTTASVIVQAKAAEIRVAPVTPSSSNGPATNGSTSPSSALSPQSGGDRKSTSSSHAAAAPIVINATADMNDSFQTASHQPQPQQQQATSPPSQAARERDSAAEKRSSTANLAAMSADVEHELSKFGLTSSDRVLESFSCALYPKKGIGLTHGR